MKEFTLLITILFNFPNGEHQEIQVERKQMSEVDCHIELEKQDDVSINFFGNTIDLFFECTPSLEDTYKDSAFFVLGAITAYSILCLSKALRKSSISLRGGVRIKPSIFRSFTNSRIVLFKLGDL